MIIERESDKCPEHKIVYINKSFDTLNGFDRCDILYKNPFSIKDLLQPSVIKQLKEISNTQTPLIKSIEKKHLTGPTNWVNQQCIPLTDSHKNITHIAIIEQDITNLKEIELDYNKINGHDSLSNLANSREFYLQLDKEFNRFKRVGLIYSLALIDIDSFHSINSTYGHSTGDSIIQFLGKEFLTFFRSQDTIARIGGDDFAVLLPDTEPQEALAAIDRFMEGFQHTSHTDISITLSIGIASITPQDHDSHIIMRKANQELIDVKNSGGNSTSLFLA